MMQKNRFSTKQGKECKKQKPFDFVTEVSLILDEANGLSSTWDGNDLPLDTSGTIIRVNAVIFDELKTLVKIINLKRIET